ncbi:MAG: TetR/AcrR family transcriptional regulator [Clostridia bacterium]|nr:TetR/AcrR family transcriptional regulator [Clostridia bacterium]
MKKEDLRITKTKRDLRYAIVELLKTNQFEKITVGDICDKAMVNRMTFYKHFNDKYDLLEHTINFLVQDLLIKASEITKPNDNYDEFVNFCVVLSKMIIKESIAQKDEFKALYMSDSGIVYDIITKTIRKYIEMLVVGLAKIRKPKYSIKTITEFLSGGIIHLLCYWMLHLNDSDTKQFSDECTRFAQELFKSGMFFEE